MMDDFYVIVCLFFAFMAVMNTYVHFCRWSETELIQRTLSEIDNSLLTIKSVLSGINHQGARTAEALGSLAQEPNELALHVLKDSFLSRKDNEGIMLVEAVEKQLKKRRKAQPKPV